MLNQLQKEMLFEELSPLKDVKDALLFCESLEKITDGAVSGNSTIAGIGSADGPTTLTSSSADHDSDHNRSESPSSIKAAPGKSGGSKRSLQNIVHTDGTTKKAKRVEDNRDITIQSQLEQHFIGT